MSCIRIRPISSFQAEITPPGDKSISHRAIMLASLANGISQIHGFLPSEDCLNTLHIMSALGAQIDRKSATDLTIRGCGGKLLKPSETLNCGNSGTTMRLLTGLLAAQPFESYLYGDASLNKRPMRRVVHPLSKMGVEITCEGDDFRPPLKVHGNSALTPIEYSMAVASAQVKSAILLAGLQTEGETSVIEPAPTRDHTERMLRHLHASLHQDGAKISIHGPQILEAETIEVPADFSSAAFWIVAAALSPKNRLTIHNVGLNPTRTALLKILMRMGAQIDEQIEAITPEPRGILHIRSAGPLRATILQKEEVANVIDEIPILAVAAALAEGTSILRGAEELRVKETDRIAALATNLRAFGVSLEEHPDGLVIEGNHGKTPLQGAKVQSFGDHRIAMAFAILGLFASGETIIEDTDCIATSYPSFEADLERVRQSTNR